VVADRDSAPGGSSMCPKSSSKRPFTVALAKVKGESRRDSRFALLKPHSAGLSIMLPVRAVVFCDSRLHLISNLSFPLLPPFPFRGLRRSLGSHFPLFQ
jgi:hypothetical protein